MFNNKNILITGGTGSFGNAFSEMISKKFKPNRLIIYSRDEYKQFLMQEKFPEKEYPFLRFFLGDVRDLERLKMAMNGVDYVIHAAALKQVPAAEYNPIEFVKTNIYGAENIIQAAISQKVKKIIALSTDKAANPINLYGATKLASDKLFVSANNLVGGQDTKFTVVRYGNVLGSRGSVIPYFKELIKNKKDYLPITHEEMTRFWITLGQSVDFVLMAFEKMIGAEIFVPKIPSAKIVDIAKAMAPNLKTKIVGIRPGEKIHELMCPNEYHHLTIEFEKYFKIIPTASANDKSQNFLLDNSGEKGKKVSSDFEYSSGTNKNFLSIEQIDKIIKTLF